MDQTTQPQSNVATARRAPRSTGSRKAPAKSHGEQPVNLRAIAREANVSTTTVSMVLNENPRISRPTRLRVQRIISQLGYQPNRLAQSLASNLTHVLAVLLPGLRHVLADPYFGELISGICDRAGKLGYKVMLEQAKADYLRDRRHLELFERRFVDGVLCLGNNDGDAFLKDFEDGACPMVVVDNHFDQWDLDQVVCDYRDGAEQAMNYLLQLGHRRIGMVTAFSLVATARDVVGVYEDKLRAAGVEPDPGWRDDGRFTERGGAAAAERILGRCPDVTAFFAGNDKMALGAMRYLARRGVRVPQDVSVVGLDDLRHTAFISPTLTTVHLPLYEVGVRACERLIERVRGAGPRISERVPTHLVVRESTAIAPGLGPPR